MKKLVDQPLNQPRKRAKKDNENHCYDQSFVSAMTCILLNGIGLIGVRYATALRPLRQYCHIVHIRPPPPSSILPRLLKICHLETIKAEPRALQLLVDSHEGDLRSCINSLQLLSRRCDNLTLPVIQESLLKAKKEGSLSSHGVVEGVFARRTAKEKRRLGLMREIEGERVVHEVNACGEFDRIMSGTFPNTQQRPSVCHFFSFISFLGGISDRIECHTHFLTQSYTETHLQKTCEAYEWLNFYDTLQSAVFHDQLGECVGYMAYCAQGFHELFAQEKNESQRTLERKRDSWEVLLILIPPHTYPLDQKECF